jgi:hypothetical protein
MVEVREAGGDRDASEKQRGLCATFSCTSSLGGEESSISHSRVSLDCISEISSAITFIESSTVTLDAVLLAGLED